MFAKLKILCQITKLLHQINLFLANQKNFTRNITFFYIKLEIFYTKPMALLGFRKIRYMELFPSAN